MIGLYSGLPGEGKTLHLAEFAHRQWLAGRTIYTNFHLNFGKANKDWFFFYELEQLNDLKNAVVCIDEGQIMFNCRRWDNLSYMTQYKLQTHRHDGLDLVITAQNFTRLDLEVRLLIHTHYICQKIFSSEKMGFGVYRKHLVDPEDDAHKKIVRSSFSFMSYKNSLYDTSANMDYLIPKADVDYMVAYKSCGCGKDTKVGRVSNSQVLDYLRKTYSISDYVSNVDLLDIIREHLRTINVSTSDFSALLASDK